jgi:hypothetical protein
VRQGWRTGRRLVRAGLAGTAAGLLAWPGMAAAFPKIETITLKRGDDEGWRYALVIHTRRVSEAGNDWVGVDPIQTGAP